MAPKRKTEKATEEDYESMTLAVLKGKAQELGVVQSGSKKDLIERLRSLAQPKKRAAPPAAEEKAPKRGKAESGPVEKAEPKGKAKAKSRGKAAQEEEPPAPSPKAKAKGRASKDEEPAGKAKAKAKAKASQKASQEEESTLPTSLDDITPADGEIFYEDGEWSVEYAKSGRSVCRLSKEKIPAGALRFGKTVKSDTFDGNMTLWYHASALLSGNLLPSSVNIVAGFSSLKPEHQKAIAKIIPKGKGGGATGKLATQGKKLHEVLDVLNQLPPKQLGEMAVLNNYPSQKLHVSSTLAQLCADGILFGATRPCEVCKEYGRSGTILLDGEVYKCTGWMTDHLKCDFQTQKPERDVWQLTPAAEQAGDGKLGKLQLKVGERLFATKMSKDGTMPSQSSSSSQAKPPLLNLSVYVSEGFSDDERKEIEGLVKSHMGKICTDITKATCFVVSSPACLQSHTEEKEAAKTDAVPGVEKSFLDNLKAGTTTDMTAHLLWGEAPRMFRAIEETGTAKTVEKEGVAMDTDIGELIERTHVLIDRPKNRVYSETLSLTDMTSGSNSFYKLYVLESDKDSGGSCYWVWRKWGRIGVSQGGTKLEEFHSDQAAAIRQFSKLYLDKTGNTYGHKPSEFVQKPGKFSRVDVAHKALQKKKAKTEEEEPEPSQDDVQDGQPLGQLSKAAVEKGNAVLDKLESILSEVAEGAPLGPVQKGKVKAHSAEFYALIPHNFGIKAPPPIDTQDLLGAERALLQFYLRMGFEEIGGGEDEEKLTPISGVMQLELPGTLQEGCKGICDKKAVQSCTTKGKVLEKKKAGKPLKPMDHELYGAILMYTGNAIYQALNKALRDEDRDKVGSYFPYLRMLFEACGRLPVRKVTLWRGVGVDLHDQYKEGSTITWWGVSSCTSDEKVAKNFASGCAGPSTLLTVETQTACEISELSFYSNEAESILLPGTQLKVLENYKKGKTAFIRLREVGRQVGELSDLRAIAETTSRFVLLSQCFFADAWMCDLAVIAGPHFRLCWRASTCHC
ncbi:PARP1 [Symbiodinium sp. CCMP2592]|nr:PARP1 [Symbiodinium sp. CCMP2592]